MRIYLLQGNEEVLDNDKVKHNDDLEKNVVIVDSGEEPKISLAATTWTLKLKHWCVMSWVNRW